MSIFSRRSYFVATGLAIALALGGCATGQYEAYAKAASAQAEATAKVQAARYEALGRMADSGSDVARVAAVMALSGIGGAQPQQAPSLAAPVSGEQRALQWASVLVPNLTQAYMIGTNARLSMRQSDNATALGLGQSRDQAATSAATFGAFSSIAGQIQAPAPSMILSGTGVIGSGSYSIGPNSGSNSGNSGRLAGGAITDNTSTPTVVQQPAPTVVRPEVVQQPAPLVVRRVVLD